MQSTALASTRSPGPAGCGPSSAGPSLPRRHAEDLARLLKALADPTRLQILSMIEGSANGEACVCDLTAPFDMTQPAISHHLRILIDAGILKREKRSSWAWYSIVAERLQAVQDLLPGPRFLRTSRDR